MAGVVFAKLTRAKARANTLLFSRNSVICLRDGKMVLMFRVGDLRKSLIVGATVKAQVRDFLKYEGIDTFWVELNKLNLIAIRIL